MQSQKKEENKMEENFEKKLETFKNWVSESKKIVFFGGAGVSTESGIPDFRSVDGLYNQKYKYPPETILSHTFFVQNTEEFYRFYRDKMLCLDAEPNVTHRVLAKWEQEGKLSAIVTQNIDGLHQKAGSKTVWELHGTVHKNYCEKCGKKFDAEYILHSEGIPRCDAVKDGTVCNGRIKPDVVLYEEGLDEYVTDSALRAIQEADMMIIAGTSLAVYPAAGMVRYFKGNRLVLINKTATPYDKNADLVLQCGLGEVFSGFEG
jgi:NAD-dependent deacetylase